MIFTIRAFCFVRVALLVPVRLSASFLNRGAKTVKKSQKKRQTPAWTTQHSQRSTFQRLETKVIAKQMRISTCAVRWSDILGLARPSAAKLHNVLAQSPTTSTDVVRSAALAMIRMAPSSTGKNRKDFVRGDGSACISNDKQKNERPRRTRPHKVWDTKVYTSWYTRRRHATRLHCLTYHVVRRKNHGRSVRYATK